jgi:hypothetical protein
MEVSQTTNTELISDVGKQKKSKHGKHKPNYYQENKEKFLLAQRKYRVKLKSQKIPQTRSFFLQKREKKALKCFNKRHLTVPVPRLLKIKHPIVKD